MNTADKIEALNRQLYEIDYLQQESNSQFSSKHTDWSIQTRNLIEELFGEDHELAKKFSSFRYGPSAIASNDETQRHIDIADYRRGLERIRMLLVEMIAQSVETLQSEHSSGVSKSVKNPSNNGSIPTRVYISTPGDRGLQPDQLAIKKAFLNMVQSAGFEPQEFGAPGVLSQMSWNFENVQSILGRCQGAVVLGLIKWDVWDKQNKYRFSTPYNHYEGALALAKNIPTFILMHEHIYPAGMAYKGGGQYIINIPDLVTPAWLYTDDFISRFNTWVDFVKSRRHVFLGYSSKAKSTAILVKNHLTQMGALVMDWAVDFNPAHTIMNEIERAAKSCLGGIFLFTKDDDIIIGDTKSASPRDNVIFEAGYFMHAKGIDKTLIIREEGTKMPADIGGHIYLSLKDRNDISPIEKDLEKFIKNNL